MTTNRISASQISQFVIQYATNIIANLYEIPTKRQALYNFGNDELKFLDNYYDKKINSDYGILAPKLNKAKLFEEWNLAKHLILNFKQFCFVEAWQHIFKTTNFSKQFPNLTSLAIIVLIAPLSNGYVEYVFSHQTMIKTKLRKKISIPTLNYHLLIAFNEPSIEDFDLEQAYKNWVSKERIDLYYFTNNRSIDLLIEKEVYILNASSNNSRNEALTDSDDLSSTISEGTLVFLNTVPNIVNPETTHYGLVLSFTDSSNISQDKVDELFYIKIRKTYRHNLQFDSWDIKHGRLVCVYWHMIHGFYYAPIDLNTENSIYLICIKRLKYVANTLSSCKWIVEKSNQELIRLNEMSRNKKKKVELFMINIPEKNNRNCNDNKTTSQKSRLNIEEALNNKNRRM
ncbi:2103_t:CDS:2 [Dentiscutata erythropus]|uniref:2103_t:CDS:1 n=1 Tax=Dentiscutata erythropus TaxID=1348616 RepID=A0A9N9HYQ9_9GLOM|nr:2103_t:CDS:2 [Dentiscutata erythropus]